MPFIDALNFGSTEVAQRQLKRDCLDQYVKIQIFKKLILWIFNKILDHDGGYIPGFINSCV